MRYKILKTQSEPRLGLTIYTLVGPTGCGKTRWAYENFPDAYFKPVGTKWWDGYTGQETVVLDEMDGTFFSYKQLLTILDVYPCKVETKGSYVTFQATTIIITSNHHPRDWYDSSTFPWLTSPLRRRLTTLPSKLYIAGDPHTMCGEIALYLPVPPPALPENLSALVDDASALAIADDLWNWPPLENQAEVAESFLEAAMFNSMTDFLGNPSEYM